MVRWVAQSSPFPVSQVTTGPPSLDPSQETRLKKQQNDQNEDKMALGDSCVFVHANATREVADVRLSQGFSKPLLEFTSCSRALYHQNAHRDPGEDSSLPIRVKLSEVKGVLVCKVELGSRVK